MFKNLVFAIAVVGSASGASIPDVPPSLRGFITVPEWWSNVTIRVYKVNSNSWAQVREAQSRIETLVNKGESALHERRELIKYISLLTNSDLFSSSDRKYFKTAIAETYARIGDPTRSAMQYVDLC